MADHEPNFDSSRRSLSVCWPILTVLFFALVLLGGVTAWGTVAIAAGIGALGLLATTARIGWMTSLRAHAFERFWSGGPPTVTVVLSAVALMTLVTTVPLPAALLRALAPANADVWERTTALLGGRATFFPLSLEPAASRIDALRFSAYALLAWLCASAHRRIGSRPLAFTVVIASLLACVATLGHQLLGAERVFGLYEPHYSAFVGPLMNPNHVGGVANLGFFCALGLSLDQRQRRSDRQLCSVFAFVLVATSVWVASRTGFVLLLLGIAVFVVVWARHFARAESGSDRRDGLRVGLVIGSGLGLSLLAFRRLESELLNTSLEKLSVVAPSFSAMTAHGFVGAGRGAFGVSVAPFVRPGQPSTVFDHAENFALQWAVEWGVPVAFVLSVALLRWLWPVGFRGAPATVQGATIGVVCLWLHNLADFSLEVPFVALCLIVASASLPVRHLRRGSKAVLLGTAALLVAGILAVTVCPNELGRTARKRIEALAALGVAGSWVDGSAVKDALLEHPADPFLLRIAAAAALQRSDPDTFRFIAWCLSRDPNSGRSLLLLAEALNADGHTSQALGALRQALVLDGELARVAAARAVLWSPDQAPGIVPSGANRAAVLKALAVASPNSQSGLSLLVAAAKQPEASPETRLDLIERLLSSDDAACRAVVDNGCLDEARLLSEGFAFPGQRGLVLHADLMARGGALSDAAAALRDGCLRSLEGRGCLLRWLRYARDVGEEELKLASETLLLAVCADVNVCAEAEAEVASAFASVKLPRQGLTHALRAAELRPTEVAWRRVAELARDIGDHRVLQSALDELRRLDARPSEDLLDAERRLRPSP